MSCEDLILTEDVNTMCADLLGKYKESGFVYDYNDIDKSSTVVVGGKVRLALKNGATGIRVYDRSFNPFSGVTRTSEENDRYVVYHDQAILPLFVNNQINAKLLNVFGLKRIVIVLEHMKTGTDEEGRYPIFGIMGGLLESSSARTDIVAAEVTLMDMNTGYPALFLSIEPYDFTSKLLKATVSEEGLSYVNLGNALTGDIFGLEITGIGYPYVADPSVAVRLPDGSVEIFTSDYYKVWAGLAGNVTMILNSDVVFFGCSVATNIDHFSSNFTGEIAIFTPYDVKTIHVPKASKLTARLQVGLKSLRADNAIFIDLSDGTISGDVLAELISGVYNSGNINGQLDISGGQNPTFSELQASHPATAQLITQLDTVRGWTITINS